VIVKSLSLRSLTNAAEQDGDSRSSADGAAMTAALLPA